MSLKQIFKFLLIIFFDRKIGPKILPKTLPKEEASFKPKILNIKKNEITITNSKDDSIGRTEVIMGNTDEAAKGKLSRSAKGLPDLGQDLRGTGAQVGGVGVGAGGQAGPRRAAAKKTARATVGHNVPRGLTAKFEFSEAATVIVRSKLNLLAKSPHARCRLRNRFGHILSGLSDGITAGTRSPPPNRRLTH